jgi:phosphopentomutase
MLSAGLGGDAADVGVRACFGDLGSTVADLLGVDYGDLAGESFADRLELSSTLTA